MQLNHSCSKHGGISSSSSLNPLCMSSNFEGNGMFIGICTRFGCATASCTCTEAPLHSGFGGILSILKLVRFLKLRCPSENTRQLHSPLSSAILCEVVEWLLQNTVETGEQFTDHPRSDLFDHVRASKSFSRILSRTLSGNFSMATDEGTGFSLLIPCNVFAKTDDEAPECLNTTFNLVSQVYMK